jgi:hypothetical protein
MKKSSKMMMPKKVALKGGGKGRMMPKGGHKDGAKGIPRVKMLRETKPTMERSQGSIRGSGVNMPMVKEPIPQIRMRNTQGIPTPDQKM